MSTTDEQAAEAVEAVTEVPPELALAIRDERATAVQPQTTLPSPREWEASMAIARQIAATEFVPESYRGNPEAVIAAILTGRELGIGPMQSLRDIHMVDGRPAFAATLMLAKMRQGGVVLLETESTTERAWIKARRSDSGEVAEFEFTIEEAKQAGLLDKRGQSWKRYPKDMLWARAVSRMGRRFGSDLLGGLVYSKEELDDLDDDGGYGGGGSGYEASGFNPAKQLLREAHRAPTAGEVAAMLKADQERIAANLDWPALLEEAALAAVGPRADWGQTGADEFMFRWNNTIAYLLKLCDEKGGEHWHPDLGLQNVPEADALIVEAFEWGFGHTLTELPKVEDAVIDAEVEEVVDPEQES